MEGRDAAHVDHVTDDLAGFLAAHFRGLDITRARPRQTGAFLHGISQCHDLAKTIDDAFEKRNDVSPATKGAVREAVDTALDLLDNGRGARRRKAGRQVAGQPVAQEGRAALVPPQRHGPDRGRGRRRELVGQGAVEVRGLGREPLPRRGLPRRAGLDRAPLGLHRAERRADAVVREPRRLCRRGHHGRHLGDGRLVRADRQARAHLRRRRHRRRAGAAAGRAR